LQFQTPQGDEALQVFCKLRSMTGNDGAYGLQRLVRDLAEHPSYVGHILHSTRLQLHENEIREWQYRQALEVEVVCRLRKGLGPPRLAAFDDVNLGTLR